MLTETFRRGVVKYRTQICINAGLLAFLLLMLWIKPVDGLRKYNIYNHSQDSEESIFPVYGDIKLTQNFECTQDVDSFEIFVTPVNDEYHGAFNVLLEDDNNAVNAWTTDKLDTTEGWIQYRLNGIVMESGKNYRLVISAPELDEWEAIGVSVFDGALRASGVGEFLYENSSEEINGADKTLSFGVYKKYINIFAILAFICLFVTVNICYAIRNKGIDWLALPVLIGSGIIMLIIMAPGSGPDDVYHYYSSMALSNKFLLRDNADEMENRYRSDLPIHSNKNSAFIETYEGLRYRVKGEEGFFIYEGRRDELKWALSHLAPATGITIGRLLRLGFIRIYTLGRLFNLIAYIAFALLAVRLVPRNKELMLMMAAIPMSLQQASQLSYDVPVNGIALVFTGYLLKLLNEDRPVGWRDMVWCLVLLTAISPIKVIYILLALLLLIIPAKRFGSVLDRVVKLGIPVITALISLIITRGNDVSRNVVRSFQNTVSDSTAIRLKHYSAGFVIDHPVRFIRLLFINAENHLSTMFKGMIGGSLAGFSLGIPEYLIMIFALCLLMCAVSEKVPLIEGKWQRTMVIGTAVLGYFAVLTVFAFAETIYGSLYIGGTQGRYLTPFMFPVLFCLCGRKININLDRRILFVPVFFIELAYIVEVMSSIEF